jgi:3-hydroxymyristoyl/3-hydroxydecanoyl-(acyl carrier protein) dehydratase
MAAPAAQSSLIDIDATYLPTQLMRQVARVTALEGPTITGEVDLGSAHWVYPQHFPGDPIFPHTHHRSRGAAFLSRRPGPADSAASHGS